MKKILLFAATATMLFAACTNEDLVAPQTGAETALEDGAVGFDVYVPGATAQTRAGRVNVMTTPWMKETGFGIFAYQHNNGTSATEGKYVEGTSIPDFMWNQQIFWDGKASAWYYAPLKYWPNETNNDSQNTAAGMPNTTSKNYTDQLSFFAYAPWVYSDDNGSTTKPTYPDVEAGADVGIVQMTGNDGICDSYSAGKQNPVIKYQVAENPNQSVDLLWGVAPAGGLSYIAVDGTTETVLEGLPLKDLKKPAVNTNLKFQFQHALARLGVKVVLAADQVASGGYFDFGNSKVTIEEIAIKGNFGKVGFLDVNNKDAYVAKWSVNPTAKADDDSKSLKLNKTNGLAEHLWYDADKAAAGEQQKATGVTTKLADAIQVSSINDSKYQTTDKSNYAYVVTPTKTDYSPTTPYFSALYKHRTIKTGTPNWNDYATFTSDYKGATTYLFYKNRNNGALTDVSSTFNVKYPTAFVLDDLYYLENGATNLKKITTAAEAELYKAKTAYRRKGDVYTPTGQVPGKGDYVLLSNLNPYTAASLGAVTTPLYRAIPNYFMVIPTNSEAEADRTLTVKITYYVSTTDPSLMDRIVYTKNEVEKKVVLPNLKNGVAYDLRLILGLTSVKVEADVADWTTTGVEVNLPQNTSE